MQNNIVIVKLTLILRTVIMSNGHKKLSCLDFVKLLKLHSILTA